MQYELPYGRSTMELHVPPSMACECLKTNMHDKKTKDLGEGLVKKAMANPYGGKTLKQLAAGVSSAVIICSDHTRPVPSKIIIPPMLRELREGNPNIDITLLIATGFHRLTTDEELRAKFGDEILKNEKILIHNSSDTDSLMDLGKLPSGATLSINRAAVQCGLLLAEGFIEPHFFAGYSGGRKSVMPGIAGRQTVLGNHCGMFIDSPYARMGILNNNPIHIDMFAAAHMAKLQYIVNVVLDGDKNVLEAFAGDWQAAHEAGCEFLRSICTVTPSCKGDIVITTNGGYPLDQNIYQAVKCMTAAEAAANDGAIIIAASFCEDGTGSTDFFEYLRDAESPQKLYEKLKNVPMSETLPDQWEAQVLARVMIKHKIIFVCGENARGYASEMKLETAASLDEAFAMAVSLKGGNAAVTIIPDGISVIVNPL